MEHGMKKAAAAMLTTAMVGKTSQIESFKTIVDLWREYNEQMTVDTDLDYLAAVLTTARLWDIEPNLINVPEVVKIHRSMVEELAHQENTSIADDQRVLCCHLASAYVAITPKIETVSEIVDTYRLFMEHVTIRDDYDKLAAFLVMGRMHDSKHRIEPHEIQPLMDQLKGLLKDTIDDG